MKRINLTKHTINICDQNGEEIAVVEPSGLEARIETEANLSFVDDGIPHFDTIIKGRPYVVDNKGNQAEMPPMSEGVSYIVSGLFRQHFDRPDLWQPGRLLRNEQGQPIGCIGLSR